MSHCYECLEKIVDLKEIVSLQQATVGYPKGWMFTWLCVCVYAHTLAGGTFGGRHLGSPELHWPPRKSVGVEVT